MQLNKYRLIEDGDTATSMPVGYSELQPSTIQPRKVDDEPIKSTVEIPKPQPVILAQKPDYKPLEYEDMRRKAQQALVNARPQKQQLVTPVASITHAPPRLATPPLMPVQTLPPVTVYSTIKTNQNQQQQQQQKPNTMLEKIKAFYATNKKIVNIAAIAVIGLIAWKKLFNNGSKNYRK